MDNPLAEYLLDSYGPGDYNVEILLKGLEEPINEATIGDTKDTIFRISKSGERIEDIPISEIFKSTEEQKQFISMVATGRIPQEHPLKVESDDSQS